MDRDIQVIQISGETSVNKNQIIIKKKKQSDYFLFLRNTIRILNFNLMIIVIKFNVSKKNLNLN